MAQRKFPVQLSFEPAQYDALSADARRRHMSISAVVRDACDRYLALPLEERPDTFEPPVDARQLRIEDALPAKKRAAKKGGRK